MDFVQARHNMVTQQVRTWDVLDRRVLETLLQIPREAFVPEAYRLLAYADMSIPLGRDEYLFKPVVEARLLQALALKPTDTVLEIGTGSAYLTACLAQLSAYVDSVEQYADWVASAQQKLAAQMITNATVAVAEVTDDWQPEAHYDAIVVSGSYPEYPVRWQTYLQIGGRLWIAVGQAPIQQALLVTRTDTHTWQTQHLFEMMIPPLRKITPVEPVFIL